jgi:hypothetical protein
MMGICPAENFEDPDLSFYGKPGLVFALEVQDNFLPISLHFK